MKFLCVNAGSSSLKFQLVEMPEEKVIISGYIEKIGAKDSFWNTKVNGKKIKGEKPLKNHSEAVQVMLDELLDKGAVESLDEIKGVGHRVLHGGEIYKDSVVIDSEVIKNIEGLEKLGPLHIPGNLTGIRAMQEALPGVTNVAVFDTAFHQTMPKVNYMYPVPYEWYEKYGVRKYGFHGTSHKYITGEMQERLGKKKVNLIICHVGSGANMSIDEIDNALNKKSGLLGICGFNDNRDVEKAISDGDEKASLALDMYIDRIVRYIAEYYVELNGKVDAIVMTAGVLENGAETRAAIVKKLSCLGLKLNSKVNDSIAGFKDVNEGIITSKASSVPVYVLPTNEEIMIIKDTYELCK